MTGTAEPEQDPLMHPPGTAEWEKQDRPDAGWSWPTVAFVTLIMGAMLIGFLLPSGRKRSPGDRILCGNNLKEIGTALQVYSDQYGSLPPAYVADASGRPIHSWRALLLPYIDGDLAKAYSFDEPWDGPNNRQLMKRIPSVYHCPADQRATSGATSYVAIVGNETMWPFANARKLSEVTDGLSNTIVLVEATGLDIPWLEPRDLEFAKLNFKVNDPATPGIGSQHEAVANILFADGTTRTLAPQTPADTLRAMLTIDGGERASRQE